jgi:hypothetical protein
MHAVSGRTPCGRFDVVLTTPASTSCPMCLLHIGLCTPSQRHLNALATKTGEKYGLVISRRLARMLLFLSPFEDEQATGGNDGRTNPGG